MHGITLIALVVTIVVLLILAGITISLVFSENGIIAKARESANKTNEAIINEQAQMNDVTAAMENMLNGTGGGDTPEKPKDPTENWDLSKVDPVQSTDATPVTVPVPKGYVASKVTGETTVENGFVIYEETDEVNDTNKDTAQTTRNQFVWVPVADVSEMYGTDASGKKWGKLYSFSTDGITPVNWTEQNGVMTVTTTSGSNSYREPEVVSFDSSNSVNLTQLETQFDSMIASVEKYGGFYIGRYETGNLSQAETVVVKNNIDIGSQTWYTIYNKSKEVAANSNVTTTMIWGCQWDATLRWMYNSGDSDKKTYTYNSTGKGNYSGTQGSSNRIIPTGSNEQYAVNNIYDMAGNARDWTIEANNTDVRVLRGGGGGDDAVSYSTSSRNANGPSNGSNGDGSRIALYI